jgi:hypothetical protein
MEKELKKHLNSMKQAKVIYSRAGGGAGSIISMELSNKYTLWIECTWRIEKKNKVIATSADDIKPRTGLIAKSVKMLEGKIIESVKLTPFYDLCINFIDDFCLRIFCIFSYTYKFGTNWSVSIPKQDLSYEITNHFEIKKGTYN